MTSVFGLTAYQLTQNTDISAFLPLTMHQLKIISLEVRNNWHSLLGSLIGFVTLLVGYYNTQARKIVIMLCSVIIIGDLFFFGSNIYPATDSSIYNERPKIIQYLDEQKDVRVSNNISIGMIRSVMGGGEFDDNFAVEAILPYTNLMFDDISVVGGQVGDRLLQDHAEVLAAIVREEFPRDRFLRLYSVNYVLASKWEPFETFELVFQENIKGDVGELTLKLYSGDVLPRAYVIYDWEIYPKEEKALLQLGNPDWDINSKAIIISSETTGFQKPVLSKPHFSPAVISHYGINRVSLQINTDHEGLLVLNDTYYPGWKVFVDGTESEIFRTNYLVRGVFVPEGVHEIEFRYFPNSLKMGGGISFSSFICLIFLIWISKTRNEY
jgi:hypothetical protein